MGCNITLNTRREATQAAASMIKRVMPRQNEQVNEIWMCDKGRFGHHYTRSADRLKHPMIRRDGKLVESTWEQALGVIGDKMRSAQIVSGLIGDRVANEDAHLFARFLHESGKGAIGMTPALSAAYADIARAHGVGAGTDFKQLGRGDVILVVNGDVEEQAPVWFLRLRQAVVDRGATLIMAHSRGTKMHRYASKILRYENAAIGDWLQANSEALKADLTAARNAVVVFGDERLDAASARGLAGFLANLLIDSGKSGKANSGLLPLYPHANTQGVFDMISTQPNPVSGQQADVAWFVGVGADEPDLPQGRFTIVQDILLTALAQHADVVLPALSVAEREGTFTSGDRRVQRFYRALPATGEAKPDWWIVQEVAKRFGMPWAFQSAGQIFAEIAQSVPSYAGLGYEAISHSEPQWPPMGRGDLYYGGTVYDNTGGLGVRYAADSERGEPARCAVTKIEPNLGALNRPLPALMRDGELIGRSKVVASHIVQINTIKEIA